MTAVRLPRLAGLAAALAPLLLAAPLAIAPGAAEANCNCTPIARMHVDTRSSINGNVDAEHNATRTQIIAAIDRMTLALIETLTLHAREVSNHLDRQVEAEKRMRDAQEINASDRLRQEIRARAESGEMDPNPFACLLLDMFGGGGGGAAPANGADVVNAVARRLAGDDPAVRAGGVTLAADVVDARDRLAGHGGSARATTDWSLLLEEISVDFSDPARAEVASRIIGNAIDPLPPRPVEKEELRTPEGLGRAALEERRLSRQRLALETAGFVANMSAAVLEDPVAVEAYRALARESAYDQSRRPIPPKLSELQQLDIRTISHVAPAGERLDKLTGGQMTERMWLEELWNVTAVAARVNFLRLELEQRQALMTAAILASLNDGR